MVYKMKKNYFKKNYLYNYKFIIFINKKGCLIMLLIY